VLNVLICTWLTERQLFCWRIDSELDLFLRELKLCINASYGADQESFSPWSFLYALQIINLIKNSVLKT
jgi:hypothetical protein